MRVPEEPIGTHTLTIKNMVCPRCIDTVKRIAESVPFSPLQVRLGEVVLPAPPTQTQYEELARRLEENGFSIIESGKLKLINQIKTLIINRVHYANESPTLKLSAYLSQNLNYDYSRISKLFSSVEGVTIERFATRQRIEKVKELLVYDQLSVSEIADQLDYSSAAHLSAQFKRETGMTPSEFKALRNPPRESIDAI